MSAPTFTAGPWRACHEGDCSCGFVWSVPADFHVATSHTSWGDDPEYPDATMPLAEMQANARLIAAAPELYEALEALVGFARNNATIGQAYVDDAEAALAKARGQ